MAEKRFATARERIIDFAIIHNGDWDKTYASIRNKEFRDDEEVIANVSSLKCKVVTMLDPEYPQQLRKIQKAPIVLFYEGDINLIQDGRACVSIVGERNADARSLKQAEDIAKTLSEGGKNIVAGSAKGICAEALKTAERPVCVMGSGFDRPYPMENKALYEMVAEKGLLISEYPPHVEAEARNFPARNRIVAGISDKMVCCKAKKHSGSLIAVAFALNFGKEVASVIPPWSDEDTVNGELIENGAFPIASPKTALTFAC